MTFCSSIRMSKSWLRFWSFGKIHALQREWEKTYEDARTWQFSTIYRARWWGACQYNTYKVKDKFLYFNPLLLTGSTVPGGASEFWGNRFYIWVYFSGSILSDTKGCQLWEKPEAVNRSAENLGCMQTTLPLGPHDPAQVCLKNKWLKEMQRGIMTSPREYDTSSCGSGLWPCHQQRAILLLFEKQLLVS